MGGDGNMKHMVEQKTMLSKEFIDKIADALNKRTKDSKCPICGKSQFFVADGLFKHSRQKADKSFLVRGEFMPCAVIICSNCGFMSEHSLAILGLIDELDTKNKEKKDD